LSIPFFIINKAEIKIKTFNSYFLFVF